MTVVGETADPGELRLTVSTGCRPGTDPGLPERDETDVEFITIDPPGSMDLDQAMHIERAGEGWRVRYAIADVPAFIRIGGSVDQEVQLRGQTIYCPDLRVPLHPPELSEAAASLLLVGEAARVAHLGSLTGYPAEELLKRLPNTTGVGVESSEACVALASRKQAAELFTYRAGEPSESQLPSQSFSHVLVLHPQGSHDERAKLFTEAHRLLYAGGQVLVSLPLSRSFPEILDLLDEFALKYDDAAITRALEKAAGERVTVESVSEELEAAGFTDIDFEIKSEKLGYDSGRAFLEDPSVRYFIVPQIEAWLDQTDLASAMEYISRAIDKYWSDIRMDMQFSIAAFSARR